MATAKERGHKDWNFGGVVKRDFKADKSDGEYGDSRDYVKRWYTRSNGKAKKKDTKRWCKGIADREHVWMRFQKYEDSPWYEFKCIGCCKESYFRPKHGLLRKVSYHSNDEYDLVQVSVAFGSN